MSIKELEQEVAEHGLGHDQMIAFFSLLPTSDALANKVMFEHWTEGMKSAGAEVDQYWLDRIDHDLVRHARLTHETIVGADHADYVSLNNPKEYHFG